MEDDLNLLGRYLRYCHCPLCNDIREYYHHQHNSHTLQGQQFIFPARYSSQLPPARYTETLMQIRCGGRNTLSLMPNHELSIQNWPIYITRVSRSTSSEGLSSPQSVLYPRGIRSLILFSRADCVSDALGAQWSNNTLRFFRFF